MGGGGNYELPSGNETFRTALLSLETPPGDVDHYARKLFAEDGVRYLGHEVHPSRLEAGLFDVQVDFVMADDFEKVQAFLEKLERSEFVKYMLVLSMQDDDRPKPMLKLQKSYSGLNHEIPWFPRRPEHMDLFTGKIMTYGAELDADHPGFKDEVYRARREEIGRIARTYKWGQAIPRIEYTEDELNTWSTVYSKLKNLFPTHACRQFNNVLPILENECGYGPRSIPQLEDVSRFLKRTTGWQLRPVQGLLSARDFINAFAFRIFHSTQYIRHSSNPMYTPEPDVVHEILGHIPLFADPAFARFSQELGIASLGASDEDIKRLSTVYWFTVEFGLCSHPEDGLRAFGAGLLSSFGELEWCLSNKPELKPFEPNAVSVTPYTITAFQPSYFVATSFEDVTAKILMFSKSLRKGFILRFNSYTNSIEIIESPLQLKDIASDIQNDLDIITHGLISASFKRN